MEFPFGVRRASKEPEMARAVTSTGVESDAPFKLEFAPGLVLIEAEIRDRQSLSVFVNALNAMGALLPERLIEDAKFPPAPIDVTPLPSVSPEVRTIDLTAPLADVPPA